MDAVPWTSDPLLAKISIITVAIWCNLGYHAMLYLAYLQAISNDYYEAAEIDGATWWQKFRYITYPMLAPAMTISLMLLITDSLKNFRSAESNDRWGTWVLNLYNYAGYYAPRRNRAEVRPGIRYVDDFLPDGIGDSGYPDNAQPAERGECAMKKRKARGVIINLIVWLLCLVHFYPFFYMLINTFKTRQDGAFNPMGLPKVWVWITMSRYSLRSPYSGAFFLTRCLLRFVQCC